MSFADMQFDVVDSDSLPAIVKKIASNRALKYPTRHTDSWYSGDKCADCGEDGDPFASQLNHRCLARA